MSIFTHDEIDRRLDVAVEHLMAGCSAEVSVFSDGPNSEPYRTTEDALAAFNEFRERAAQRNLRLTLCGYGSDIMRGVNPPVDGCYPMIRLHRD